jgi:hypothetical protein
VNATEWWPRYLLMSTHSRPATVLIHMAQVAVGDQPFATPGEPGESRPVTGHGPGGPAGRRHEDRAEGAVGQGGNGPRHGQGRVGLWASRRPRTKLHSQATITSLVSGR